MTELKIQIPDSPVQGTAKYVKGLIDQAELKIYTSKSGAFCIGAKLPEEDKFKCIAFASNSFIDEAGLYYNNTAEDTFELWPDETEEDMYTHRKSYFGNLTPAAKDYVDHFITECSQILRRWIDNDEPETYLYKSK